jgi:hypothetical protein
MARRMDRLGAWCLIGALTAGCGAPISSRQARKGTATSAVLDATVFEDSQATDLASLARAAVLLPEARRAVVEVALAMAGARARQYDCSSFAQHVFASTQTPLPRTTRRQFESGHKVPTSQLQAGDLVFFAFSRRPVDHVGIYTGRGSFVHVSSSTRSVRLETLSQAVFANSVVAGRRFLDP